MKKTTLLLISFLFLTLTATPLLSQDGIKFETGSWKEVLEKARTQNKLVFIDVYTEWCGPCKQMVKNIFPLKVVGDMFNEKFINYKIDAEKGEGIEIGNKYNVKGYPTYLFVNGDGVLFYSFSAAMPADQFMAEADKALAEFNDPEPFPILKNRYEANKNNQEYLLKLMQKQHMRDISNAEVAEQYFSLVSKERMLTKEILTPILSSKTLNTDGALFEFLIDNRDIITEKMGYPNIMYINSKIEQLVRQDINRAIEFKDEVLLSKITGILLKIKSSKSNDEWIKDGVLSKYYAAINDEPKLIEVIKRYSKSVLNYDKKIIAREDSISIVKFNESEKTGAFQGMPKEEVEIYRKMSKSASINYAYQVRDIAAIAANSITDNAILNQALSWINLALEYSDNFTIDEIKAEVLFKLGRVEEAVASQEVAISKFESLKMNNEPIIKRLQDKLTRYKKKLN